MKYASIFNTFYRRHWSIVINAAFLWVRELVSAHLETFDCCYSKNVTIFTLERVTS